MGFRRTLATIALAGVTLFYGAKISRADYVENFNSRASVDNWVKSTGNALEYDSFNGGCASFSLAKSGYAYVPFQFEDSPFTLTWDSYIDSSKTNSNTSFGFGIFQNENSWTYDGVLGQWQDSGQLPSADIGSLRLNTTTWAAPGSHPTDAWIHNRLTYIPGERVTFQTYEKSDLSTMISTSTDNVPNWDIINFTKEDIHLENIDKMGLRWAQWSDADGGAVSGYIDNINYTSIPEPATIGLLGAGVLAALGSRRKTKGRSH